MQLKVLNQQEADEECCTPECGPETCGCVTAQMPETQAPLMVKRSKKSVAQNPCTCT